MQTENMQQQMHTLRQREMAVASTPDRAEPVRNEQLVPPRTPVQARPIAPRAEMRTASSNKPAEQLPDEQTQAVEPKSARRVETDAWKSYVTENGKLVTDAIEYGQGYRQEQREIISDRTGDSVVAASAASGVAGAAAVAGTTAPGGYMHSGYPQQTVPYQPPMLVSGLTNPGLPTGQLTHADPQHMLPADTPKESTTGPAFWIMLIVIVAAFFAAALI